MRLAKFAAGAFGFAALAAMELSGPAAFAAAVAAGPAVKVAVVSESASETVVRITVNPPVLETVDTPSGQFQRFSQRVLGQGGVDVEHRGLPELPIAGFPLALPLDLQTEPQVTVKIDGEIQRQTARIYPVQPVETASSLSPARLPFEFDPAVYATGKVGAGRMIDRQALFRGDANVDSFRFAPYGYDPSSGVLVWYPSYTVTISHPAGPCFRVDRLLDANGATALDDVDRVIEQRPLPMLKYALNQTELTQTCPPAQVVQNQSGARFLIITHPNFLAAANDLKAHKQALGISTEVISTGDITGFRIPATAQQIRNWIANYWNTHAIKPKWLLLIGDAEFLPTHYDEPNIWDSARNAGDIWYGQFQPGATPTTLPPFGIGRFPVDTLEQAQTIVNKVIAFENSPPPDQFSGQDFYSRLTFASYFEGKGPADDRWFVETSEIVRNYVLRQGYSVERIYAKDQYVDPKFWRSGAPIPEDLRYPAFTWKGDKTRIAEAVNEGTVLLYHRDHGWWFGWDHPELGITDLAAISVTNNQFPIVFSINCASGVFDNETVDLPANIVGGGYLMQKDATYWAEAFLRKPDGALAIIGDTRQSSSYDNNHLTFGLFDAVYPGFLPGFGGSAPVRRLGDVLNHAKAYVAAVASGAVPNQHPLDTGGVVPGVDNLRQELNLYNLLGDPTVTLRTHGAWTWTGVTVAEAMGRALVTATPERCKSCPLDLPPPDFSTVVAINPATGGVIGRALLSPEGRASIDLHGYQGNFWVRVGSDEGVTQQAAKTETDRDRDGVADSRDNCTALANASQLDSDGDGYGNRCDADFNNDGIVNSIDLALFRLAFGSRDKPNFDLNGDGIVNSVDLALFRTLFGGRPGPSAWHLGGGA